MFHLGRDFRQHLAGPMTTDSRRMAKAKKMLVAWLPDGPSPSWDFWIVIPTIYTYMYIYTYVYINMYGWMDGCMYGCMYVWMHGGMYVCIV